MEQDIRNLRDKLHKALEDNDFDSELVLEISRELDNLILLYYSSVPSRNCTDTEIYR